jgi:hypothetical protein
MSRLTVSVVLLRSRLILYLFSPGFDFVPVKRIEYGFIDYKALFSSCALRHDSILLPLLLKLKNPLVAVQDCLNKVDEWLSENSVNASFLKSTFDVGIEHVKQRNDDPICGCLRAHSEHQIQVKSIGVESKVIILSEKRGIMTSSSKAVHVF